MKLSATLQLLDVACSGVSAASKVITSVPAELAINLGVSAVRSYDSFTGSFVLKRPRMFSRFGNMYLTFTAYRVETSSLMILLIS
uniref:Putative secreted protein n=1 Tax=Anopheles marajoara TaxID=58244 RepID=A0A2M4CAP7_9DIPT